MAKQAITPIPGLYALSSVRQMVPLSQGMVYLSQGGQRRLATQLQQNIHWLDKPIQ